MQFKRVKLPMVHENNGEDSILFRGIRLGQTVEKPEDSETCQKTVRIYRTAKGPFLVYVTFNSISGDLYFSDYVKTDSLDPGEVRSALKKAEAYPGACYSRAIYKSLRSLEKLR